MDSAVWPTLIPAASDSTLLSASVSGDAEQLQQSPGQDQAPNQPRQRAPSAAAGPASHSRRSSQPAAAVPASHGGSSLPSTSSQQPASPHTPSPVTPRPPGRPPGLHAERRIGARSRAFARAAEACGAGGSGRQKRCPWHPPIPPVSSVIPPSRAEPSLSGRATKPSRAWFLAEVAFRSPGRAGGHVRGARPGRAG